MSRWIYLAPRLMIAVLMASAIWLGKDPLIRYAIVKQTQQMTGARVEIGQLRSSIENGKLYLKDLKITDPRDPMKNFLQADMVYAKLDMAQLWHRNLVIEEGQTSRLVFGAPRTESGALIPSSTPALPSSKLPPETNIEAKLTQIGQKWLDQIPHDSLPAPTEELEVAQLTQIVRPHWQKQIENFADKIKPLNPAIERLQKSMETEFQNPLRDPERYQQAASELQSLQLQAVELRNELGEAIQQVGLMRGRLQAAKNRDQSRLTQRTRGNPFDEELISQLLLYRHQQETISEIVRWFRCFRESIPDPRNLQTTHVTRETRRLGVDVDFSNTSLPPDFLIKRLELEGEGRLANQHFNFFGTAFDVTTQPHRHDKPTTFNLRAQGNQHVTVNCEIDRRSEPPIDKIHVQCPDLVLPPQLLGHSDSLQISLGPASRLETDIEIQMMGDQMSGTLVFNHSNVALHVDKLNELAGGSATAERINQDLIQVNQFTSTVTLNGTLDEYEFESKSDLGKQLAATVERVVIGNFNQQTDIQISRLNEFVALETKHLETVVQPQLQKIANQLKENVNHIAVLQESVDSPTNQAWPKIRR